MSYHNANTPKEVKKPRQLSGWLLIGLEVIVALLLIYSLRFILQPSWAQNKLNSLRAELAAATDNSQTASEATATIVPTVETTATPVVQETYTATPTVESIADTAVKLSKEVELALKTFFKPLPELVEEFPGFPRTDELVDLGRMLYYDPRLSHDESFSCNKCHDLQNYGVDGLALSLGVTGEAVERNSPTVYNTMLHVAQFWDGRSPHLEDQATKPIMAAGEMGMIDEKALKSKISAIKGYQSLFAAAFPNDKEPISLKNVGIAIGAFERGLLTPSRFDAFLAGDRSQFNDQELRGLNTFVALRCVTCHTDASLGGTLYKKLGVIEPYTTDDMGRYVITQVEADKYVFKVPSLRNVAKTAPYLHDGSIQTLEEMVRLMARHQLGKSVTDSEVDDVVAFLNTLTGEIPTAYIAQPTLP